MHACPLCGAGSAACGGPSTAVPIDADMVTIPERKPTMPGENMLKVELKPGDVRRVNPRDKDRFLQIHPGARVLGEDEEPSTVEGATDLATEQANINAQGAGKSVSGPASNKGRRGPSRSAAQPAEGETPPTGEGDGQASGESEGSKAPPAEDK